MLVALGQLTLNDSVSVVGLAAGTVALAQAGIKLGDRLWGKRQKCMAAGYPVDVQHLTSAQEAIKDTQETLVMTQQRTASLLEELSKVVMHLSQSMATQVQITQIRHEELLREIDRKH